MAYKTDNLISICVNKNAGGTIPNKWAYWDEDNDSLGSAGNSAIEQVDYFSKLDGIKEGDQIEIIKSDKASSRFCEINIDFVSKDLIISYYS